MPQTHAPLEDDLPAALAANLDATFERLVLVYQDRLYAFALRLTCNRQDAEEAAQDAFVRAYHALQGYDAGQIRTLLLRPWLYQIALNVVRNRVRRKQLPLVSLNPSDQDTAIDPPDDGGEQPEAKWERTEQQGELAALVSALPERYRAAVILRHVEGLGYREVATVLDQPVGTVKANVHRGVHLLREEIHIMNQKGIFTDGWQ